LEEEAPKNSLSPLGKTGPLNPWATEPPNSLQNGKAPHPLGVHVVSGSGHGADEDRLILIPYLNNLVQGTDRRPLCSGMSVHTQRQAAAMRAGRSARGVKTTKETTEHACCHKR